MDRWLTGPRHCLLLAHEKAGYEAMAFQGRRSVSNTGHQPRRKLLVYEVTD